MDSQQTMSNDDIVVGSTANIQSKFDNLVRTLTASERLKMLKLLSKLKKLKKYDGKMLSETEVRAILDDVIPGISDTIDATASIVDLLE